MSASDDDELRKPKFQKRRDYVVGKGQPPVHTRFRKGVSGNSKGRPPGSASLKSDLEAELRTLVSVTENGKTTKITKQRLFIKKMYGRAIGDDRHANAQLIDLILRVVGTPKDEDAEEPGLTDEDEAVLAAFEAEIARKLKKKQGA